MAEAPAKWIQLEFHGIPTFWLESGRFHQSSWGRVKTSYLPDPLSQVYLLAIAGHVPSQMVHTVSSFMEFCYLVWHNIITEDDILAINNAVTKFHVERSIFDDVRPDGYSLPCQHSLVHYTFLIQEFGAPNGLCSSITESKHIKAIKEPWQRSSHYEALGQMLVMNQHLDKLAAARVDFQACGMLDW